MPTRIAVLASGRGSNLRALVDYFRTYGESGARAAEVVLVASDKPDSGALAYAREAGISSAALDMGAEHVTQLTTLLQQHGAELIVLAGYLRLVPPSVVAAFRGRVVNVHPALLPAFGGKGMYGERVHRAVIASGARVSGATAHFVDEVYDRGAIIAQWPVPVFADDTPDSLAERVLRVEHLVLPRAVEAVATRRVTLGSDGEVRGALRGSFAGAAFTLAARDDAALASDIATALFEQ
jgi:phosphoribosylglycinamide formyltransferase 1